MRTDVLIWMYQKMVFVTKYSFANESDNHVDKDEDMLSASYFVSVTTYDIQHITIKQENIYEMFIFY